jgi:esterase
VTTLVAVNGLGGLEYLWEGFRAELPSTISLRVLDLPGHGDRPPAADYRYGALVTDVADRTADLDPFPLIGWSVGAAVAWLFAARHPGRATGLVLLDPAVPHQSRFQHGPTPEPVHPYTFASVAEAVEVLRGADPTATDADVRAGYRVNRSSRWEPRFDPAIFPALVEDARARGEEMYLELGGVRVPTLVLRGERSFLGPEQVAEIASALPDARVETVAGAGHFMVRERPAEVVRQVVAFLAGRPSPGPGLDLS